RSARGRRSRAGVAIGTGNLPAVELLPRDDAQRHGCEEGEAEGDGQQVDGGDAHRQPEDAAADEGTGAESHGMAPYRRTGNPRPRRAGFFVQARPRAPAQAADWSLSARIAATASSDRSRCRCRRAAAALNASISVSGLSPGFSSIS